MKACFLEDDETMVIEDLDLTDIATVDVCLVSYRTDDMFRFHSMGAANFNPVTRQVSV